MGSNNDSGTWPTKGHEEAGGKNTGECVKALMGGLAIPWEGTQRIS